MSSEDFVDSSGSRPRLRIISLMTTVVATIILGFVTGIIDVIEGIGGWISGAIASVGTFVSGDVVGRLIVIGTGSLRLAWAQNIAFLRAELGVLAFPIAVFEVVVVVLGLIAFVNWMIRQITGVL